jgi:RNA polymerase sigma-70 factor (ECF subfamily)
MTEETVIVARLSQNAGDERAWADFYEHYRRQIIAVLFFRGVRQATDQDEITAEVFFRFLIDSPWHHDWTTLPSAPEVRQYLLGRASSIASHTWERRLRRAKLEAELLPVEAGVADEAPFFDFEHVLDSLAEADRDLAILYYQKGISLTEVAALFHTTYQAAGVRLHRLRRKMLAIIREKPFSKK